MDEYLRQLVKEVRETLDIPSNDLEFNRKAGELVLKTSMYQYLSSEFSKLILGKVTELVSILQGVQNIPAPNIPTTNMLQVTPFNALQATPVPPPSNLNLPVLTDDNGTILLDDDGNPIHHVDYEIPIFWRAIIDGVEE